jgi:hypothetical protein
MRAGWALVLALSIMAGALVVNMAGFGAVTGEPPAAGIEAGEKLEEKANDSAVNSGLEGGARSSDGELVGLAINGIGYVFKIVEITVLLPFWFEDLGLPWYTAYPAGLFIQVPVGIQLVEFATNRELS